MRRLLLLILVVSACRRSAPAPSAAAETSGVPASPPPTAAAPASASASAAPAPEVGCDLRWGFHGTVAGQEAFLRLERTADEIKGRYFYAKFGVDIPLEGTLDADNHIALTEGDPKKPSGHFKGTCDLATGVLSGTWTGNKPATLPFRLEPVKPRPVPLVAKKKLTIRAKAKTLGPMKMTECKYQQELVEIFGASTKEAEAAINKQGAADATRNVLATEFGANNGCETGEEVEYSEEVASAFRGFVTIRRGGTGYQDGAAHPNNAVAFDLTTFNLETGGAVTDADLWGTLPEALVRRCDAAYFGEPDGSEDFLVAMWPDGRMFNLTERGVHIYSVGFPHFASGMTGQGPTLAWGALLREGALKADSPAKRAWEGIAKAKPGDPECFDDDGKRLR
jgi:hypothetical protein